MYCKFCGNDLPDDATFCPRCGNSNPLPEPERKAPVETPEERSYVSSKPSQPSYNYTPAPAPAPKKPQQNNYINNPAMKESLSGEILKFGILGLAFGSSGTLSILGLIFSIIAKSKLSLYARSFGQTEGKATAGKVLSTIGLIVSCVYVFLFTILFASMLLP